MNSERVLLSVERGCLAYKRRIGLFRYEKVPVLNNLNFDVYAGESLAIIGRNGAGKSSLLRLLAGIIDPDGGVVVNHGASTSLLTLQAGFNNFVSGRKNIFLSGLLLGYAREGIESNLDNIIAFSELGEFIDRPVRTYSAGMRARLGFSICHHLSPDVLMIDEVLGVGDVEFRKKSSQAMKQRLASDQTIVLVSHDANVVSNLCDRAVWIEDGKLKDVGPAGEIIEKYNAFVAAHPRAGIG